jgi:transposase
MYTITFSKAKLEAIKKRKQQEKDKKILRRLYCLELKAKGVPHKEIADCIGVSQDTITHWVTIYIKKGLNGLSSPINYDRRSSSIDPHINTIKILVKKKTISTLSELQDVLKNDLDIIIEESWLSRCCKKNSIYLSRKPA